jgi:hypothetical protein
MILNASFHRIKEVIHRPSMAPYRADNFDEIFPIYYKSNIEPWHGNHSKWPFGNPLGLVQDRTRTLPHYLKMGGWEPLPVYDSSYQRSFKELVFERAHEIIKIANGQRINISWSGGLDSTTLLFALMEIADLKQLKVFCNYNSIVESSVIYDRYLKGKVEVDLGLPVVSPKFGEGLILTGYHGDSLFPNYSLDTFDGVPELFTTHWKDWLTKEQVDVVEPILENYPNKEIVQMVPEYLSFVEINFKWQWSKTHKKRNIPIEVASRVHNFYETVDFQKWAIGNYEPKYRDHDKTTYKWTMRQLLKELMGASFYTDHKRICTSHYDIISNTWVMLLEDGTNIYMKDLA